MQTGDRFSSCHTGWLSVRSMLPWVGESRASVNPASKSIPLVFYALFNSVYPTHYFALPLFTHLFHR
jgi:hypothetical protein